MAMFFPSEGLGHPLVILPMTSPSGLTISAPSRAGAPATTSPIRRRWTPWPPLGRGVSCGRITSAPWNVLPSRLSLGMIQLSAALSGVVLLFCLLLFWLLSVLFFWLL